MNYLVDHGITNVDSVLISHADADHIGGLIDLFLSPSIEVGCVYLNTDAIQSSDVWKELRVSLANRFYRGAIRIIPELTSNADSALTRKKVRFEVLHPTPVLALTGPGGRDTAGQPLAPNRMSAVVRLVSDVRGEVLLAGDMDKYALEAIVADGKSLQASVLVFPHHGGLPGATDIASFVEKLCTSVKPTLVVICNGRGQFHNPNPHVVQEVQKVIPNVHIACSQLCKLCTDGNLIADSNRDKSVDSHCAGTVEITLALDQIEYQPTFADHSQRIDEIATTALCRRTPMADDDGEH